MTITYNVLTRMPAVDIRAEQVGSALFSMDSGHLAIKLHADKTLAWVEAIKDAFASKNVTYASFNGQVYHLAFTDEKAATEFQARWGVA